MVARREDSGDERVPFEGDADGAGGDMAVGHPLPFCAPARGQARLGGVNKPREAGIGLLPHRTGRLPLCGNRLPGFRDRHTGVGIWLGGGFEELGQGIAHVVDRRRLHPLRIGPEAIPQRNAQDRERFAAPGGSEARLDLAAEALERGDRRSVDFGKGDVARRPPRRHEHPGQRVIVFLRDRIELVIMAAGTAHRHRQKRFGEGVDLVVDHLLVDAVEVEAAAVAVLAEMKEHRPDLAGIHASCRVGPWLREKIAGDMLADDGVEADVIVERPDEVVAVVPRAAGGDVPFVAIGVGVADDIHPVTGELFAEMGRGEEGNDDLLRRGTGRNRGVERRRQAGEHQRPPAAKRRGIGRGRRLDPGCIELRADEAIDRIPLPGRIGDARGLAWPRRLEAPPGGPFGELLLPGLLRGDLDHAGIGGTAAHPVDEMGELLRRESALGGHLEFGVCVADRLDEERFLRGPGNDRRPLVPSPHPATPRIEGQAPFDLVVVGMAGEAARLEHREDGVGEEALVRQRGCRELRRTDGKAAEEAQR